MTVDLAVVVIGCGRSGTAWASHHLTEQGVPCGHESVFDWHPSSQPDRRLDYDGRTPSPHEPPADVDLRAESSLAAIAHLSEIPPGCDVWHVARNPLACAASWAASRILDDVTATPYGRFIAAHVPEIAVESTALGRAVRWVAEWNLRGARAAAALRLSYQLSRLDDIGVTHRPVEWANVHHDGLPRPTMSDAVSACSAVTADRLVEWADVAGYAL